MAASACRGRKPQLLPIRVHTPYQAKALPFIKAFSISYWYGGAGKECFNPATPYDTGQAKVAECLTHQGYRAMQPSLQGQAMLHYPSNGAPANVPRRGGATSVALSTPVAPYYHLENQGLTRLPSLPCRAVLPGRGTPSALSYLSNPLRKKRLMDRGGLALHMHSDGARRWLPDHGRRKPVVRRMNRLSQ
jgi:hypothetical protein